MVEPNPVTYRMLGMTAEVPNPDAPVTCSYTFDEGHEPDCDIVKAHDYKMEHRFE